MTAPSLHSPTGARKIAEDVHVFASGAYAMTSGVVLGAAATRPALLVDPGYFPGELDRIVSFLEAEDAAPQRIVLTHSDWDHVAGASRWPDAVIVASSEYPRRAAQDGARITRSLAELDRKLYVRRDPPFVIPVPGTLVGSPCDLIWTGPRARLLPAGGHTVDGLMVLLRDSRVLFAGDHLSDREIPFVGHSLEAYKETLLRVRNLIISGEVETLVPGHGDVCGRDEALARIDDDADYLGRLEAWVRETIRTVTTLDGILERCEEVVFGKGSDNPDIQAEHRGNVRLIAAGLGIA